MSSGFEWKTIPLRDYERLTADFAEYTIVRNRIRELNGLLAGPEFQLSELKLARQIVQDLCGLIGPDPDQAPEEPTPRRPRLSLVPEFTDRVR
jgi:hypothetical protein